MMAAGASHSDEAIDARRWKKELMLAKKREQDWFTDAEKIVARYRGEEKKRNRYNVLWSNTETIAPALYNSRPSPDVRRRFRDADPIGKAVSEVLERSLSVFVDHDETDDAIKNDVLDSLLCGRGVSRLRYTAKISSRVSKDLTQDDGGEASDDGDAPIADISNPKITDEAPDDEEVESELVTLEHVDWKDFRHGYGRVWPEVPWVAFRHKLSRPDAEEKFGDEAVATIEFTVPEADEDRKASAQVGETQKIAEFWEIWDKLGERVFFLHDSLEFLLFPEDNPDGEPPLEFDGFFPCPKPLMVIENTGSLLPIPPFHLYEDQANQLDKLSMRIDKIVGTMKLRGVYDARLPEMADLLSSDDNDMTPIQNAQAWVDGGLDKAISWMPVEKNAEILQSLYEARERQKAIIDELTGISDIIRGATDAQETATAQQLKSNYGSVRLQRKQKEVQRYAKDIMRLAAGAMSQKFSIATFEEMTELKFPTAQQKQLMISLFQQQQMRAAMQPPPPGPPGAAPMMAPPHNPPPPLGPPGAPQAPPAAMPPPGPGMAGSPPAVGAGPMPVHPMMPPPPPPGPPMDPALLKVPTWEDLLSVMRSDKRRQYKIDVETNSTIADTLSSDMAGLSQVLQGVAQTMTELAPMVEQGVLPVDSAKELIMAVIRRARLGIVVEDAFDKMQAPKPKPDPKAAQAQAQAQADIAKSQAQAQADVQKTQAKGQIDAQLEAMRQQGENQRMMFEQHFKTQREQFLEQQKSARDENDARFDALVRIIVATISAQKHGEAQLTSVADREIAGDSKLPDAPQAPPVPLQ